MLSICARGANISGRVQDLFEQRRCITHRIVIGFSSNQGALRFARPDRRWGHSEKRDARFGDLAGVIKVDDDDHARNRKVTVAPGDLFQRVTGRGSNDRKNNLPKNFIRLQSRGQVIDKKFLGRNDAIDFLPGNLELRIEGQSHCRKLGRGIGMNKASTYGAAVANGDMTDVPHCLGQYGAPLAHQRRALDPALPRHGANRYTSWSFTDAVKTGNAV